MVIYPANPARHQTHRIYYYRGNDDIRYENYRQSLYTEWLSRPLQSSEYIVYEQSSEQSSEHLRNSLRT